MQDLVITNGFIIDGTGTPGKTGSLSMKDKKITEVWYDSTTRKAKKTLDVKGQVVCPGFIDTHTHSDMSLLWDGRQPSSITQGVTTEILGQDGLSYAPLSLEQLEDFTLYLEGLNGPSKNVALDFTTATEYLSKFQKKTGVNVAWLAPHGAIRQQVAGFEARLLTPKELKTAREILRQTIREGARGLSTGLSYFPGAYSDTQELIELCKTVAEEDGVYVTHLRTVFTGERFDPVEEAIEIAKQSGVKLHFSHYRTGIGTLGKTKQIMKAIDNAIGQGLDITLELYPYPFGASYAAMFLPPWASEGGAKKILQRLENPSIRRDIAEYINEEFGELQQVISYAGKHPHLEGEDLSYLASRQNTSTGSVLSELLWSEQLAFGLHEKKPIFTVEETQQFAQDIFLLLERPEYMVGSDAIHLGSSPHPRGWGTFARMLRMAREENFPLETLIHRMTKLPATRFSLPDRGVLKKDYWADISIFAYETVSDQATIQHPKMPAKGFSYVFVNGEMALEEGLPTDTLSGHVL